MKVKIRMMRGGEEKSVPRQHARVLVAVGRAEYVTERLVAEPECNPESKPAPRPRRQYKRRDMAPAAESGDQIPSETGIETKSAETFTSADEAPQASGATLGSSMLSLLPPE